MDSLVLYHREQAVREFPLRHHPLEAGRAPGCDIVVHGRDVAARKWLVKRRAGRVVAYDLAAEVGRRCERPLALGDRLPLGQEHALVWVRDGTPALEAGERTEPLGQTACTEPLSLIVGRGREARRIRLASHPVAIGTAPDNDLVLVDRAVSAHHCRIDPFDEGLVLRDLGSRNGTWVDGVAVGTVRIGAGTGMRVGRTDLYLVPRTEARPLVAESAAMRELLTEVARFARLEWPTLVLGESGVGKEGVARALHAWSGRAGRPFVAVNAGGLSADLIESQLFGHERGAFTGAQSRHRGVFEQAEGGTLFLDEIGELPMSVQARLLRVLENWAVRPLGAERERAVDVRLVCATHRDLRSMVRAATFREDLYYRIARLVVTIAPLRDRPEDVLALARHFLRDLHGEIGGRSISQEASVRLLSHPWPGNARELRNVVAAAAALSPCTAVSAEDVDRALAQVSLDATGRAPNWASVVDACAGNLSEAARALGVPRETLRDRIRRSHRGR